jgi:Spy/CpxP family protein refolding chaperone
VRLALWLVTATAMASLTAPLRAQQPAAAPPARVPDGRRGPDSAGRARLEGDVRRGFARAVRQRVGLSDDQIAKLRPVSQRYEQQRRQLQIEERDTRMSLRQAMRDERTADAKQVDGLLHKMVEIQQRRARLLESEQRDLAAIMSPFQRAKYMALQEQVRRRLEQMRQRRVP